MLGRQPLRFWYLLGAIVCFAILAIGLRNQLGYYIHPRYHIFTMVLAMVGGVLMIKATFDYKYRKQTNIEYDHPGELAVIFGKWLLSSGAWFVLIVAVLLLWSPAKPLLSRAAERKQKETASVNDLIYKAPWFNDPKSIHQIVTVLATPRGPETIQGKEVEIVGFVRADQKGNPDVFQVSRFLISCCAVDATPSSIPVFSKGWTKEYPVDSWVSVKGTMQAINIGGKQTIAIADPTITRIEQPAEPYEFISF